MESKCNRYKTRNGMFIENVNKSNRTYKIIRRNGITRSNIMDGQRSNFMVGGELVWGGDTSNGFHKGGSLGPGFDIVEKVSHGFVDEKEEVQKVIDENSTLGSYNFNSKILLLKGRK